MRVKFGRGPTVVSKKGSLKFISRWQGSKPYGRLLLISQKAREKGGVSLDWPSLDTLIMLFRLMPLPPALFDCSVVADDTGIFAFLWL